MIDQGRTEYKLLYVCHKFQEMLGQKVRTQLQK
uniref:UPF0183 protein At3g51130 isoform X2 n=1 Tax=Rhizophora mucronata TaxID=61149 RepID=A0A2P2L9T9_RHIMU